MLPHVERKGYPSHHLHSKPTHGLATHRHSREPHHPKALPQSTLGQRCWLRKLRLAPAWCPTKGLDVWAHHSWLEIAPSPQRPSLLVFTKQVDHLDQLTNTNPCSAKWLRRKQVQSYRWLVKVWNRLLLIIQHNWLKLHKCKFKAYEITATKSQQLHCTALQHFLEEQRTCHNYHHRQSFVEEEKHKSNGIKQKRKTDTFNISNCIVTSIISKSLYRSFQTLCCNVGCRGSKFNRPEALQPCVNLWHNSKQFAEKNIIIFGDFGVIMVLLWCGMFYVHFGFLLCISAGVNWCCTSLRTCVLCCVLSLWTNSVLWYKTYLMVTLNMEGYTSSCTMRQNTLKQSHEKSMPSFGYASCTMWNSLKLRNSKRYKASQQDSILAAG